MNVSKILIGSDHAGLRLKNEIISHLADIEVFLAFEMEIGFYDSFIHDCEGFILSFRIIHVLVLRRRVC